MSVKDSRRKDLSGDTLHSEDRTHSKDHFKHKVTSSMPLIDYYLDSSWSPPPPIVYTPDGSSQNISVSIYRASNAQTNSGPSPVSFYNNFFTQYLYLPLATTTTNPVTTGTTLVQAFVLTRGVLATNSSELDATALYYTTNSIYQNKAGMPTFGFRSSTLALGSTTLPSGSNYISGAGVVDYQNTFGQEVVLAFNDSAGTLLASYVWRKIDSCFVNGTACPAGYASGPEDLFLQQSI